MLDDFSTPPDLLAAKQQMIQKDLRGRGIRDEWTLHAMARVPRERFVPAQSRSEAYADNALPIGLGQTISQPYIVALMTEMLQLTGAERVLEIGTGSGYQTAVLAEITREVLSVERIEALSRRAAEVLGELGYANVTLIVGDGTLGYPQAAPYDRILVTAGAPEIPRALTDQLADGGILVMPVGDDDSQCLQAVRRRQDRLLKTRLTPCRFVRLVGEQGWPEGD